MTSLDKYLSEVKERLDLRRPPIWPMHLPDIQSTYSHSQLMIFTRERPLYESAPTDLTRLVAMIERAVGALEWLAGKDEGKPYVTYYERTLDDGTTVPTFDEVAESALTDIERMASGEQPTDNKD